MQWVPGNLRTVVMIGTFRMAPRLSGLCLLAHLNASPTSNQHQSQTSVSSECFMNLSTFAPLHPSTPGPSHRPLSLEPPTHTLTSSLSFLTLSLSSTQQPNWSCSSPLTSCHGPHLTQNKTQLLSMTLTSRDLNDLAPHHHSDSIPCHSLHPLLVPKHTSFTPGPLHMFPLPGTLFLQMYVACHLNSFSSAQRSHFQRDCPWPLYFN